MQEGWTFYGFEPSQGPFSRGEFRRNNDGSKALLRPWNDAANVPTMRDHNLPRWGPISAADLNPHIQAEGTNAYIYDVQGVRVSFQLWHVSRRLRSVALKWRTSPPS